MIHVTVQVPAAIKALPATMQAVAIPAALHDAAEYWHKEILPEHFETSAYPKRNYPFRTPAWNLRKGTERPLFGIAAMGGNPDSLFHMSTDRSRTRIMNSANMASVIMQVPRYAKAGAHGRTETEPEMTQVTDSDRDQLAVVFGQSLMRRVHLALAQP